MESKMTIFRKELGIRFYFIISIDTRKKINQGNGKYSWKNVENDGTQ